MLICQAATGQGVSVEYAPFVSDVASYYETFETLPPTWLTCDLCRFPMFLAQIITEERAACHKCGFQLLDTDCHQFLQKRCQTLMKSSLKTLTLLKMMTEMPKTTGKSKIDGRSTGQLSVDYEFTLLIFPDTFINQSKKTSSYVSSSFVQ